MTMQRLAFPLLVPLAALSALAGCSSQESAMQMDAAEEAAEAATDAGGEAPGSGEIKVSLPQIAYTYRYGYRVPAESLAGVQQKHADYCAKQGPAVCRIINLEQSGLEGDYATGMLEMDIVASKARSMAAEFSTLAKGQGGEQVSTGVTGEDLSKQIVDTEARLRSRRLLAERLTEVLRTRQGSVEELVQAERAVAEVNEEIDQAQSWLAEMKGRVAFSHVTISYESDSRSSGSFTGPIRDSINSFGSIMGMTLGAIITFIAFALPWAILIGLLIFLWRRFGKTGLPLPGRWSRRKARDEAVAADPDETG